MANNVANHWDRFWRSQADLVIWLFHDAAVGDLKCVLSFGSGKSSLIWAPKLANFGSTRDGVR